MTQQDHASLETVTAQIVERERRAKRRTTFLILVPAILAILLVSFAAVSLGRAYVAEKTLAQSRKVAIEGLSATVDRLQADQVLLAAAARRCEVQVAEQTKLLNELQQNAVARRPTPAATLTEAARVVREAPAVQRSVSATVRESSQKRVARIYLEIAAESQRDPVRSIQDYLLSQGYNAPGIQDVTRVGGQPPTDTTQVRYFHEEDKATAERIVELLTSKFGVPARLSYNNKYKEKLGHLEIWFKPDAFDGRAGA